MRTILTVSVLSLFLNCTSITWAQDAGSEKSKLESAAEKRTPASHVDFNAELQVPLHALSHLGQTIEEAREEADPICLASAANILAAAEALAGDRRASVTSAQLWDETIKLAELRNSSTELAVLARLCEGDTSLALKERSQAAKADEEAAAEAVEAGETAKDLNGDLHIYNRSHEYVHLYVDGRHIGDLAPHQSTEYHLHHAHVLEARSHYHVWRVHVESDRHHYDWVIHDPHHPH